MKISAASRRPVPSRQFTGSNEIADHVCAAIRRSRAIMEPWPHWQLADMFPRVVLHELADLPLSPAQGASGRREYCNERRVYFDEPNIRRCPLMRRVARAMQSYAVVDAVHDVFGAPIDRTFLRIEYALDTEGFWLEPHTDIGVKKFTCFIYLDGSDELGTDIYADAQIFMQRMAFLPNTALAFVPSETTWHGFAPRPIAGVRRSLIINYVGSEWRAREQLSFPDRPVRVAR